MQPSLSSIEQNNSLLNTGNPEVYSINPNTANYQKPPVSQELPVNYQNLPQPEYVQKESKEVESKEVTEPGLADIPTDIPTVEDLQIPTNIPNVEDLNNSQVDELKQPGQQVGEWYEKDGFIFYQAGDITEKYRLKDGYKFDIINGIAKWFDPAGQFASMKDAIVLKSRQEGQTTSIIRPLQSKGDVKDAEYKKIMNKDKRKLINTKINGNPVKLIEIPYGSSKVYNQVIRELKGDDNILHKYILAWNPSENKPYWLLMQS
jgi:hypothetical protein